MFGLKILKLAKLGLMTSVALAGISVSHQAMAGDVNYPTPDAPEYPTPVMPPVMPQGQFQAQGQYQAQGQFQQQSQYQQQSSGDFLATIDVSTTYNQYSINNGTTTTSESQKFVELRPYFSYGTQNNGMEIGGSLYSTFAYEFGGTSGFSVGRSELDFLVKNEGNFAFGITGGYDKNEFMSDSPDPVTSGKYTSIDVAGFVEKRMGQFGLSLTGSYQKDSYGGTEQSAGWLFDETYRDNSVYGGALRLNYHIDQDISVFAEASYTRKKFVTTPTPNTNETAYGIRVGSTYNFNNQVALEVAGKYSYHTIECGCQTDAFGGDAKLVASLASNVSGSISIEGEITKSTVAALDSKSFRVGADLSYKAAANIELSAGAEYDVAFSGPNKGKNVSANANVSYNIHNNIDIFAGANYGYQTSVNPGWSKNMGVTVGLSLHN